MGSVREAINRAESFRDLPLLVRKKLCETSTLAWMQNHRPHLYRPYWHTCLVDRELHSVYSGQNLYLAVNEPPRCGKPIFVETPVMMADGSSKSLGGIRVGDWVMTHKGRGRVVKAVYEQPDYPSVEIFTEQNRRVWSGVDHPFLTSQGWQHASKLFPGDFLIGFDGSHFLDVVRDVRHIFHCDCRCLLVDDDHTFIADGLVVHNTDQALRYGATRYLALNPTHNVWVVTYNQDTATRFGGEAKAIFEANASELFGLELDKRKTADDSWRIAEHGGTFNCIGWGGGITGNKVHMLVIDDLIKSDEEAMSLRMRDKMWNWVDMTAMQRVQNNKELQTKLVVIGCLDGDSKVKCASLDDPDNGRLVKIKNIRKGWSVWSCVEGSPRICPVTNKRMSGIEWVWELKTESGRSILATDRHPFMRIYAKGQGDPEWARLMDLQVGDDVAILSRLPKGGKPAKPMSWAMLNRRYWKPDRISSIKRVDKREVWDLEVETGECFVANDFLVHNTRWHDDDYQGRLFDQESAGGAMKFRKVILPAYADLGDVEYDGKVVMRKGDSICPDILPLDYLQQIKRDRSRFTWNALYQQRPLTQDGLLWPSSYFDGQWVDGWPSKLVYLIVAIDPATGRALRDGDYSAIVALGADPMGNLFCEADQEKDGPVDTAERLTKFCARLPMQPDVVVIESNGFQFMLSSEAVSAMDRAGVGSFIQEVNNKSRGASDNKQDRITEGLDGLIRHKAIQFVRSRGTMLLVKMLKAFPSNYHDDGPDALELASWALAQF